jgi:two-component system sensor histidine kinase PilS (NtrC family)
VTQLPPIERFHVSIEGPVSWLRYIGAVRIAVLGLLATGVGFLFGWRDPLTLLVLGPFYLLGFGIGISYMGAMGRNPRAASPLLTWSQVLVDFALVAATVSFTGGPSSIFTFLFVVVILEAGLLLGPAQGFLFASLASVFTLTQIFVNPEQSLVPLHATKSWLNDRNLNAAYNIVVQVLAYHLTAAISGYWNRRVQRIERFQREILDNMNNGFIITDMHGMVTVLNKAGATILGLTEEVAVGMPVQDVLQVTADEECPALTALRTGRDFTRYEIEVQTARGDRLLLGLTTSCMVRAHGHLSGVIVAFTDLTELSRMREEVQRQDRLAAVGELAAGLAHEIRNPVAAIRGAVEELRQNLDEPAIAERLAGISVRESDHLNYIISEFLAFAREPRCERDPIELEGLIEEVAALLRRQFDGADGLTVRLGNVPPGCRVSGDRDQLKQVFINIGKNGIEAMESAGILTVSASHDAQSVAVVFEDEGPGIPPDQVARIFEPFYTTRGSGVGMGLAVCMRIVTSHDGTIHVASRREGGTAMTVRLPRARVGLDDVIAPAVETALQGKE